jgi:hypothetical protein
MLGSIENVKPALPLLNGVPDTEAGARRLDTRVDLRADVTACRVVVIAPRPG